MTNQDKVKTESVRMLKIIEALQTTPNIETFEYKSKTNELLSYHFEKLNNAGTRLCLHIVGNGHIISSFSGTIEEVKKELHI